jgi:hypothetical protein
MIGDQTRNKTFVVPPICDRVKVLRARIPLDRPLHPTVLSLVLLLHPVDGEDLVL